MHKIFCLALMLALSAACRTASQPTTATPASAIPAVQTETAEPLQTEKPTNSAPLTQAEEKTQKTTASEIQKTSQEPILSVAETPAPKTDEQPKKELVFPAIPAPDQAVFEDEELIDFSDRSLHPFAGLVPDKQAPQSAPWAYEQLKYGIYYTFIKAGTAYIRNRGLVNINGREAYLLQTTAFSAPVIDAVFKVRDINQSWLDAKDFYSLGYGQSVREGTYLRDEWVTFDYQGKEYKGLVNKKKNSRPVQGPLEIKVVDMLSSLYYVRSQDLKVGQDLVFDIVNRAKQYPLLVKVLKKEKVKTAAGTFNTILVEPQIRGEGIFVSKGKNLKVWVTDDEYKMPVKMKVEVFIGSVSAELLEYQRQESANIL
ncbi:DUF3108 domain-containing protein [Candidatus Avelusimicrobium sp.]